MIRAGKSRNGMSNQDTMKGKPVSASASEMAEVVLPAQTDALGKLLGGHVMHMVDIVAAMAASRHANSHMVTASVDLFRLSESGEFGRNCLVEIPRQSCIPYFP